LDMKLIIDDLTLQPGEAIDPEALEKSSFRSPGVMHRLLRRLPRGHVMLETNNCTIACFDEEFSLFPCTHNYLNRDRQWQTQASILLVDGVLQKVVFQVVEGVYAAPNFLDKFKILCMENFGDPKREQRYHYYWENDRLSLTGFLHADHINAEFIIESRNN
jgi:hypothetical protein